MSATEASDWSTERIGTVRLLTRQDPTGCTYHVRLFRDGDIASAQPSQVSPWLFTFDDLFDPPSFMHIGADAVDQVDLQRLRHALKFQAWCGLMRASLHFLRIGPRGSHA